MDACAPFCRRGVRRRSLGVGLGLLGILVTGARASAQTTVVSEVREPAHAHAAPHHPVAADEAVRIVTFTQARVFDVRLPDRPLSDWLQAVVGSAAAITWTMAACDGRGGERQCVSGRAAWPDGSGATVTIDVDPVQRGLPQPPTFLGASVHSRRGREHKSYSSLTDFAAAARSVRP